MRDANLNVREDELLPIEQGHGGALLGVLWLVCLAVVAFLAGYSFHILWVR